MWSSPSIFISENISKELFVLLLSVPTVTFTPYWRNSGNGATPPVASFIFDTAQRDADIPAAPINLTSFMVSHAE